LVGNSNKDHKSAIVLSYDPLRRVMSGSWIDNSVGYVILRKKDGVYSCIHESLI